MGIASCRYMKSASLIAVFACALAAQGCLVATDGSAVLTVENQSRYALYDLYLTPVGDRVWGEDLLYGDALAPGEWINIYDIDCGYYDVMVTDSAGAECILTSVDLCFATQQWIITDRTLARCDRFGHL